MSRALRVLAMRRSDEDVLRGLLADPRARADEILKDDATSLVVRARLAGRDVVVKHWPDRGAVYAVRHGLLPSRARRCLDGARALERAGIATPGCVAAAERRTAGVTREAWFVHEFVPGVTLDRRVLAHRDDHSSLADLAAQVAGIWAALGRARLVHDDLKAQNFIVDPRERVWLIDLDGMRTGFRWLLYRRARAADLESHFRSWRGEPEVSAIFEAAFTRVAPGLRPVLARLRDRGLA